MDRCFLDLSSKMAEPFCSLWHLFNFRLLAPLEPQKFENCTTKVKEIAVRVFIVLGAILSTFLLCAFPIPIVCSIVLLGVGIKILRAIGFAFQKGGFTHIRGTAEEKSLETQNPQLKVMSWNICGIGGGLSLDHGGVNHWRSRLSGIVEKIKREDPDVLILQEVYDTALLEALVKRLDSDYAHFFTHLGPNIWGSVGGCMILSKCAVHEFSHTSFANNQWTLNRGFASLELKADPQDDVPFARIIGTHLIHGDQLEDKTNRTAQVAQIVNHVAQRRFAVPTLIAGDLNIERDQENEFLSAYFHPGYQGIEPTCTNRLVAKWDGKPRIVWDETIDYISLFKSVLSDGRQMPTVDANIVLEDMHLVKAYDDTYNTKTALSDHHGLSVILKGI